MHHSYQNERPIQLFSGKSRKPIFGEPFEALQNEHPLFFQSSRRIFFFLRWPALSPSKHRKPKLIAGIVA